MDLELRGGVRPGGRRHVPGRRPRARRGGARGRLDMRYLLATDTCVVLLKRGSPLLLERILQHSPSELGISALTLAELSGAAAASKREVHAARVTLLRDELPVLAFDEDAAIAYG